MFKILILISYLSFLHAYSPDAIVKLTQKEKVFLKNHPTITLGTDKEWEPYSIENSDGSISGYDASVLNLINQLTGANFVLKRGNWKELIQEVKDKKIEGLSTGIVNDTQSKYLIFSESYINLKEMVFTNINRKTPIKTKNDLKGKIFAVYKNNSETIRIAKTIKGIKLLKLDTVQDTINAVTTSKADALLGNAAMMYILAKMGDPLLKPSVILDKKPLSLVFSFQKDLAPAVSIVNKALKKIGKQKLLRLKEHWFQIDHKIYETLQHNSFLTPKQRKYLAKKGKINICIDPDWMPFERFDTGGHYVGMSADYFKLFATMLNTKFIPVKTKTWEQSLEFARERKCDILSLTVETKQRKKYLNFTKPYLRIPIVMATKLDAPFTTSFLSLKDKKLGIPKGYAFAQLLKNKYPNLDIVDVANIQDGLRQVNQGKLYGYIGTLASIGYAFQKKFTGELKIAGKFDGYWELGVGIRNDDPILFKIMQKAINSISDNSKQKILNNWLSIKYEKGTDYSLIWKIIIIFIIILAIVLFFYLKQNILKNKIKKQKEEIELNHTLLKSIFGTIPNPIFYKDKNGIYQNCNNAFSQNILGIPQNEIIGKGLYDFPNLIPKKLADIYKEKDDELLANPGSQSYETEVKCSDGKIRIYNFYKATFSSMQNKPEGIIGVMLDITKSKEREKDLEKLASKDPLTKLYNRRYFSQIAQDLLELSKRDKKNICLAMIDIDNFKSINDTYGHQAGDDVIVAISSILTQLSRKSDVICRFGGEEFIILFPETKLTGAFVIAEKIRKKIESSNVALNHKQSIYITVSIGLSKVNIFKDKSLEISIKEADDALYKAKNSGKNKICK